MRPRFKKSSTLIAASAALALAASAHADLTNFGAFDPVNGNGGSYGAGGSTFQLTDGNGGEATSGFGAAVQNIGAFNASFTYTATGGADGAAFILQNDSRGTAAIGGTGGSLGYGDGNGSTTPVTPSAALQINLWTGSGQPQGVQFATNGNSGRYNSLGSLVPSSGDPINVNFNYNGSTVSVSLTDTVTSATYSRSYANVSLPAIVGGSHALIGFSGGTGGVTSTQTISNFNFQAVAPTAVPAYFKPIAISGLNQDLVVENGASNPTSAITGTMDNGIGATNGATWYEKGYNAGAASSGLPHPGQVASFTDPSHLFNLASYTGPNAIMLTDGNPSQTLTLDGTQAYHTLSILTSTGGGTGIVHLVIHHADGTVETTTAANSGDWFNNDPTAVIADGRVDPSSNNFDNVYNNNPRLYTADFTLADTTDPISSIDVIRNAGSGGNTAVFALSGVVTPEPASLGVLSLGALGLLARRRRQA
jgi:PEP-CTERM motif